ncbi:MAG: SPFH domain-containing protein [Planctomycetota bacterium]
MNEHDQTDINDGLPGPDADAQIEAMPVETPRRAASLTLREDDARTDRSVSMEAANQSLADALKIAYVCVQGVMILLIVAFFLSGYQVVDQSEEGLRVRFGAVQDETLQPGVHLSWPKGLGEIVRVGGGQQQYQLAAEFMPSSYDPSRDINSQLRGGSASLRPGADGSLITADGLLVHAQSAFTYRRDDIRAYTESVLPEDEEQIVKAMVRRAMVHAFAETPIDGLLTRGTLVPASAESAEGSDAQPARQTSLEGRLQRIVNEQVRDAEYGIVMDSISVGLITPPIRTRDAYQQALTAESEARAARESALGEARGLLNAAAGTASRPLLALIDEFERRTDLGDEPGATEILDEIFAMLDGEYDGANVEVLGETYPELRIGGDAASVVRTAFRTSRTMGDIARREAETFQAKLKQYNANPRAFVVREWTEGMNAFLDSPIVQSYILPPGTGPFELQINTDPEIAREQQRDQNARILGDNIEFNERMPDRR